MTDTKTPALDALMEKAQTDHRENFGGPDSYYFRGRLAGLLALSDHPAACLEVAKAAMREALGRREWEFGAGAFRALALPCFRFEVFALHADHWTYEIKAGEFQQIRATRETWETNELAKAAAIDYYVEWWAGMYEGAMGEAE